jgi:hypothetical protein
MASSASTILRLELMTQGENDSTWGTKTNTNLGMLESGLAGTTSISTTGGDTTLTNVDYTNDQAKKRILDVSGTLVSNATIIIPNASKKFQVFNRTTGSFTLTVKTSSGSGIEVPQSTVTDIYCNGSNVVRYASPITSYDTGAPATASGAAASSVSVTPTGNLAASNVQAALAELQGDIDTLNSGGGNYQPLDAGLTEIAALSETKGNLIVGSGTDWSALTVGTNGYTLVAKSGATNGVIWASVCPAGTVSLFYQAAAPTGWTVSNTDSDKAIRVVSGTSGLGGAPGGTTAFTSVFTSRTIATTNLPAHTHTFSDTTSSDSHVHNMFANVRGGAVGSNPINSTEQACFEAASGATFVYQIQGTSTAATLGETSSESHTHTVSGTTSSTGSGTAMDFAVQYISVIKASKDAY